MSLFESLVPRPAATEVFLPAPSGGAGPAFLAASPQSLPSRPRFLTGAGETGRLGQPSGQAAWASTSPPGAGVGPAVAAAALALGAFAGFARNRSKFAAQGRYKKLRERHKAQAVASRSADLLERWVDHSEDPREEAEAEAILERLRRSAPPPSRSEEPWRYNDLERLFARELKEEASKPSSTSSSTTSSSTSLPSSAAAAAAPPSSSPSPSSSSSSSSSDASLELDRCQTLLGEVDEEQIRLVFVDGVFVDELSQAGSREEDLTARVGGFRSLCAKRPDLKAALEADMFAPSEPELEARLSLGKEGLGCASLLALNESLFQDGALVVLPDREPPDDSTSSIFRDEKPLSVEVAFISSTPSQKCHCPRVIVKVGKHQKLRLVESHLSADRHDRTLTNALCRVDLGEGAEMQHDLLQQKADDARFLHSSTASVAEQANYELRVVQTGASVARASAAVGLRGEGASCKVVGLSLADEKQQLDLHSVIHHSIPGCKSEQLQKNIVGGLAECIFKGSIVVDKEAQQTDSTQLCRTLLLSKKAKVKAMPSLQIRADDVACAHGAAVTELDEDEIFYMRSRGLQPEAAKRLLLLAFPQDTLGDLKTVVPLAYQRIESKLVQLSSTGR